MGKGPEPMRKRAWTEEEDLLLVSMVEEFGPKDWSLIAEQFWSRGGKQCRERWHNHLRYGVTKEPWRIEEEWLLALGVKAFGNKWSKISHFLPGRTDNTIKNHWNCKMKPKKEAFEQRIREVLDQDIALDSDFERNLVKMIKSEGEVGHSWQSQDVMKVNFRMQCKSALVDYYRLQTMVEEGMGDEIIKDLLG